MTELELHQRGAAPATVVAAPFRPALNDPTGGRLIAWAEAMDAAYRMGQALCTTAFVPAAFKGKPEEAAAAILYGDGLGLNPLQALQSVHVISGKPGLYAEAMVAIALTHGHEVWTLEKTDSKVTVAGRRKGSTHVHEETWTMARAQKAGYTNNKKYASDPQAMLYARAASVIVRLIAPDALAGISQSIEEIELSEPQPTVTVARTTPPARAQRRPRPEPAPAAEPELEPPSDTGPELRTEPQMRKLWALAKERGLGDPDDFKAYISEEIGHPISSTKELTKTEAGALIDQLEAIDPGTGEDTGEPQP